MPLLFSNGGREWTNENLKDIVLRMTKEALEREEDVVIEKAVVRIPVDRESELKEEMAKLFGKFGRENKQVVEWNIPATRIGVGGIEYHSSPECFSTHTSNPTPVCTIIDISREQYDFMKRYGLLIYMSVEPGAVMRELKRIMSRSD